MREDLLRERDALITTGVTMLRKFAEADQVSMIAYEVPDEPSFTRIVQPWIELKNTCIFWHEAIKKFVYAHKIDYAAWYELLTPPESVELVTGLGAGGEHTEKVINQIEIQIRKGLSVLKQIRDTGVSAEPASNPTEMQSLLSPLQSLTFKKTQDGDQRLYYILNENFEGGICEAPNKGHWKNLYKIADSERVSFGTKEEAKAVKDYFNSDKDNRLWSKGKNQKRPLLITENNTTLKAANGLFLAVISKQAWNGRINKTKK